MNIPCATYRVQFNKNFTFQEARSIISYLCDLGISHIYASPIFKAKKGSMHGYDIADPRNLNEEIGERGEFDELAKKVSEAGLGWIQDFVPNHMAFDSRNQLLMEVLENGPGVLSFEHFDIEWNHQYESIRGRLLTPILGDIYGECLERGEIQLSYDRDGFYVRYYEHRFPLRIETYALVLKYNLDKLKAGLSPVHSGLIKLLGVLFSIKNLPAAHEKESRKAQVSFTKAILWELYTTDEAIRDFINATIREFNGVPGRPETFSMLDMLHAEQLFKLSYWKVATEELNYRRFFTVNDLISVRVEDEQVFRDTHELVFELLNEGKITGLRIDHIDGLYDPHTYLERLRRGAPESYIVVEKILGHQESLPNVWPVQGTTGYDFCSYVNSLFCRTKNQRNCNRIYGNFIGFNMVFDRLTSDKKRLIILKHMAGDIDNLALLIKTVSGRDRRGTDITLFGLRRALVELLVYFPVYRSYINHNMFSSEDRSHLQSAISNASRSEPGLTRELAFIERFLLLRYEPYASDEEKREWTNVVMRFQQFTAPLMAKGFEDTVLYIYNRLISLNDVGGWPQIFGISSETFHRFCVKRFRNWPNTMNTTSTHDTKRGEDIRARINVLSEIPAIWEQHLKVWSKINRQWKMRVEGGLVPDPNDEYFFYQTLIGAFPHEDEEYESFVVRIRDYMLKAVREAKVHTAWIKPDSEYEHAVVSFVDSVLDKNKSKEFFQDFLPFQETVSWYGFFNSLSQCLLKITTPGIPDFYQGTELWDLSLVDPDNRRAVRYDTRAAHLTALKGVGEEHYDHFIPELISSWKDGRVKMFLIYRSLQARKMLSDVFQHGTYIPLTVKGTYKEQVVGFARKYQNQWAVTVVPRYVVPFMVEPGQLMKSEMWKDTVIELPESCPEVWYNAVSAQKIHSTRTVVVGELFKLFPCALFYNKTN